MDKETNRPYHDYDKPTIDPLLVKNALTLCMGSLTDYDEGSIGYISTLTTHLTGTLESRLLQ